MPTQSQSVSRCHFTPCSVCACTSATGKAAKKNQKRAAKRKADAPNPIMAPSPDKAGGNLSGWGEGVGSEAGSDAGGSDYQALMGNARFITGVVKDRMDLYHLVTGSCYP